MTQENVKQSKAELDAATDLLNEYILLKKHPEMLDSILEIDGERCTLKEFLEVNTKVEDVHHISIDEAEEVLNLNVGESAYVGLMQVKRLS